MVWATATSPSSLGPTRGKRGGNKQVQQQPVRRDDPVQDRRRDPLLLPVLSVLILAPRSCTFSSRTRAYGGQVPTRQNRQASRSHPPPGPGKVKKGSRPHQLLLVVGEPDAQLLHQLCQLHCAVCYIASVVRSMGDCSAHLPGRQVLQLVSPLPSCTGLGRGDGAGGRGRPGPSGAPRGLHSAASIRPLQVEGLRV